MDTNKTALIGIIILFVGIIALPQTLSLFVGQHNWYDTTQNGIQVPCEKCHSDIYQELSINAGTVNKVHSAVGCESCHITTAPKQEGSIVGNDFHASTTISCLSCHGSNPPPNNELHKYIGQGGLTCIDCHGIRNGVKALKDVTTTFTEIEVHKEFIEGATNSDLLKDSNEACIACHTHVSIKITWTKPTTITMNATVNTNGEWDISNIEASGESTITTTG